MKYAAHDAAVTWLVYEKQREVMSNYPSLLSYYNTYAMARCVPGNGIQGLFDRLGHGSRAEEFFKTKER
jgi:hypothetical protein